MLRSRTTQLLLVVLVLVVTACSSLTTTPVPAATKVPPTETLAIVVTQTEEVKAVHSEKFATYSPNGKHLVKIVTDDDGETWNLVLDGKVRDEDVEELGPVV